MNSASLCSLAGRYENPIPPRCLAPIDFLKIPALLFIFSISRYMQPGMGMVRCTLTADKAYTALPFSPSDLKPWGPHIMGSIAEPFLNVSQRLVSKFITQIVRILQHDCADTVSLPKSCT
jgi:hypothetical protein